MRYYVESKICTLFELAFTMLMFEFIDEKTEIEIEDAINNELNSN